MQQQPHNIEAEQAVIGSVLINPEVYYDLAQLLRPDDFYIIRNRWIWEAYQRLHERRIPLDFLTVTQELESTGRLAEIGGAAYLTSLINQVPSSLNAEAYAGIILDASARRKWLDYANRIVQAVYRSEPIDDQMADLHPPAPSGRDWVINGVTASLSLIEKLSTVPQAIPCHVQRPDGTVYGLPNLTHKLGGLPRGQAILLGAATQTGKTALAFELAEVAVECGYKVLYVTTESTAEGLILRRVCARVGIPMRLLRTGELDEQALERLRDGIAEWMAAYPGMLFDERASTAQGVIRSIRRHRPELVIVDHIGELKYGDNKTIGIAENFEVIRYACRDIGATFLAVAQIMLKTDGRPQLQDIRWASGDLAEKADIVLLMYRPDLVLARHGTDEEARQAINSRSFPVPLEIWIRKDREGAVDILVEAMYDLKNQIIRQPTEQEKSFF